jgi:NDP-sugar pyrophosphorylase family protein
VTLGGAGGTPRSAGSRPSLCGLILAAGEGTRLRPLTEATPKALCPVGNVPLLDRALHRLAKLGLSGPATVAVNACYLADQVVAHVGNRAYLSVEGPAALGTSGAVANLRDWIAGRAVLVGNADAYLAAASGRTGPDLAALTEGWDGRTVRMLGVPAPPGYRYPFGKFQFAGFSLLPWSVVAELPEGVSDLVRTAWRPAEAAGRFEVIEFEGTYLDTGTPADYLAANLHAAGDGDLVAVDASVTGRLDRAVIGARADVRGGVTRGVVWPGGYVGPDEDLVDAIRVGRDLTVGAVHYR